MKKKKRSSAKGCLFWLFLAAALAVAAFAARKPIEAALEKLMGGKSPTLPKVVIKPLSDGEKEEKGTPEGPPERDGAGGNAVTAPVDRPPDPVAGTPPQSPPEKPPVRKTRLFFANVDPNGKILLKGVIRAIPSSDSPLRDTVQTLLAGPNSQEVNMGLLSMIPSGSRLRGVTVRGDTAFMDFSENFRFNTLGREGLDAQLKQVVFAATEYPTVKRVQILIEGKKVQYLGPEGIRIDSPLTRQSFQE